MFNSSFLWIDFFLSFNRLNKFCGVFFIINMIGRYKRGTFLRGCGWRNGFKFCGMVLSFYFLLNKLFTGANVSQKSFVCI